MVLIEITIKAPNQRLEDQTIECDLEWTVKTLKTHISAVYPSKPRIEDQRLIYSGHLLKNEQSLRQVLQPIDDNLTFTIHLVCAQSSHDFPKHIQNNNNSNVNTMAANNSNSESNTSDNSSNPPNDTNNVNTNPLGFQSLPNGQFSPNLWMGLNNPSVVIPPDQMWQQMAAIQQAYVAQYMNQYFNQNPYINQNVMNTNPTIANPIPPMPPMVAHPHQPIIDAPNAAQVPQPQPQVQRLNAGPGGQAVVDDDDEPRNRDWLDCFYWLSRAVVLLSIIYFYSSFTRFVLVVFLSILLYIYQTNWFYNRNNNNNRLANVVNNNNNNNEMAVNREEDRNDAIPEDETEVIDRPQPQLTNNSDINEVRVTEERFTGLRFCWVVVSSLFTSLIPDNPAVNVNLN